MKKKEKWLIAVSLTKGDNILKVWSGKVSYDVTDVTVPENTIFYFFSTCKKANLEVTQLKLSEKEAIAWISEMRELVQEGKLYSEGIRDGNSVVLGNSDCEITVDDFIKFAEEQNLTIEFVK